MYWPCSWPTYVLTTLPMNWLQVSLTNIPLNQLLSVPNHLTYVLVARVLDRPLAVQSLTVANRLGLLQIWTSYNTERNNVLNQRTKRRW
jgi:hypothetical protein